MKNRSNFPEFRQYEDKKVVEENIKDKSRMFENTSTKKSFKMILIGLVSIGILFGLEYLNSTFELQGALRVLMFLAMFVFIVLGFLLFYGVYYLILDSMRNINIYIKNKIKK